MNTLEQLLKKQYIDYTTYSLAKHHTPEKLRDLLERELITYCQYATAKMSQDFPL